MNNWQVYRRIAALAAQGRPFRNCDRGTMRHVEREATPTTPEQITARVLGSFQHGGDERIREVMRALVGHLHAFAREVRLTQEEWEQAIAILTRTGEITDARR